MTRSKVIDIAEAVRRVACIDFSMINAKLRHEDPKRWSPNRLRMAEEAYRRFLALNLMFPAETLAVNDVLDDYWHNHILDTEKYAVDCQAVFGRLLQHYPYFGLPGFEEGRNVPAFAVTERLWEEAFGTHLVADTDLTQASRLTLDRVIGGVDRQRLDPLADDPDAGPKGCKNGQHCNKIVGLEEVEAFLAVVGLRVVE